MLLHLLRSVITIDANCYYLWGQLFAGSSVNYILFNNDNDIYLLSRKARLDTSIKSNEAKQKNYAEDHIYICFWILQG